MRAERRGAGQAKGEARLDHRPGGTGLVAQADQDQGGGLHGAGDDHAADWDDHPRLSGDHARGQQHPHGGRGTGCDGGGGDRRCAGQPGRAAGGDTPGDEYHHRQPADRPGQAGVVKDQQQHRTDRRQLYPRAHSGDGDLAGQVQALPPRHHDGDGDQGE